MRFAILGAMLSGCTLVVGSDPEVDHDGSALDAAEEADSVQADAGSVDAVSTPVDVVTADIVPPKTCDAGGCNATKNTCKTTCANVAKACNDKCNTDGDGKSCHDLCAVQQASCNNACVEACDQCVMGCGPPCAN